jgi:dehydrogenase/reductase SDR family protein 12
MSYMATAQWWVEGQSLYTKAGFLKNSSKFSPLPDNLSHINVAVSGANSGLGYAVSKQLYLSGAHVHMLCRNRERGERAMQTIQTETNCSGSLELHIVDISDSTDVKR